MSDHDVLDEAMLASRKNSDGVHAEASRSRTTILARAREDMRRRRRALWALMPLAAAFIASAAWGAVTGRLPLWLHLGGGNQVAAQAIIQATAGREPHESDSAPVGATLPPSAAMAEASPALSPMAPSVAESQAPPPSMVSQPSPHAPPSLPLSTGEESLYRKAHTAHFVEGDPSAALRGWDAYLAAYPEGRFALEARYNRAISLARLGRRDEARAALAPFARGDNAGYRQREATDLLDAMGVVEAGGIIP